MEPRASSASGEADEALFDPPTGRFRSAVAWSYVLSGGRLVSTLAVSFVLARLLGPEAFGIIAIANVIVLFIEMFVRQGLVAAIVQRPRLTRVHLDTAFWMTLAAAVLLVPVVVALSGWWSRANDTAALQPVIVSLSPILLINGLSVVQEAQLRRRMDFRVLAVRTNVAVVAGGLVGIVAAFAGAGVYALVIQQLTTKCIEAVVLWTVSDWRPRRRFDVGAAKELLGFSGKTALASLGVFLNQRADALLVGVFFGPIPVGLYRMALRFVDTATDLAAGALQSVSLPELARLHQDQDVFVQRVFDLVRLGTILTVPILGVLGAMSEPLMRLLGPEWAGAVTPLRLLCILGVFQLFTNYVGPILQAAGKPGALAVLSWTAGLGSAAAFTATGIFFAGGSVSDQVTSIALARIAFFVPLVMVVVLPVTTMLVGVSGNRIIRIMAPTVLATAGGAIVVTITSERLGADALSPWTQLVATGVTSAVLIGVLVLGVEPASRRVLHRIRRRARPSSSRPSG